ncbi:DUF397 domain-containing protein [Streptomyces sp. CFMR 7]|uniref:DUF397 domain-containing protein n=1 Tax=Streptomyces sp. CFMR 7 TaxID=1649184 RepID=UPI0028D70AF9|nr:DUF397 domain-containing protein [Streptomyces sp. CFMR 7]
MNTDTSAREPIPEDAWFKSSFSDGTGNNCIEVANQSSRTYVRDSKQKKGGPTLAFPASTFSSFIETVRSGGLDSGTVDS